MVRIGVKYCGGCNPVFDRAELVRKIVKLLPPDHEVTTDNNLSPWDIGIMVCGCPIACTDKPQTRALAGRWIVAAGTAVDLEAVPEEKMAETVVRKILNSEK